MHMMNTRDRQSGFSLIEVMVTLAILLSVSAIVVSMSFNMTMNQASVANRSDMHASVRSVTEMIQQELTQAGRIAWPSNNDLCDGAAPCDYPHSTLTVAVARPVNVCGEPGNAASSALTVDDPEYLFAGIRLIVDVGDCQEVVAWNAGTGNAMFKYDHAVGAQVRPAGAFGEGILATSTGTVLQMYGDVNDDGNMVYVEYVCAPGTIAAPGSLTRLQAPWDADDITDYTPQILLNNVLCSEDPTDCTPNTIDCFTYQRPPSTITITNPGVADITLDFSLNVGVTLTAKAQFDDLQTGAPQLETKALLNVSPRNVFQAWQLASVNGGNRHVQPTPPTITALSAP